MPTTAVVNEQVDVNSTRSIVSSILMHTAGPQILFILPAFVQGLKDYGGFDEKQAGFIASAETMGITLGAVAIILIQSRFNWRHIFYASLILVVIGNIVSASINDFETFRLSRYVTGFGAGCLLSLSYVTISLSEQHDRNFGYMIMTTLIYAAILVLLLPTLYSASGFAGLLYLVAFSCFISLYFVKDLPGSGKVQRKVDEQAINLGMGFKIMGLASMHIYFLAMGGIWAYIFLIGMSGGSSEQAVANALSISQIAGMAGAFGVALLGIRYGRSLPLTIAIILTAVPVLLMLGSPSTLMFTVLLFLFYGAQNMSHPYLLGSIASFDRSGTLMSYSAVLTSLGYSGGSYIAASIIPGDGTFDEVIWMSVIFFTISLVLILIPNQVYARKKQLQAAQP